MEKKDKLNKIIELKKQQFKLFEKSIKIANLPKGKRTSTAIKRAYRVVFLAIQVRMIQEQINVILATPISLSFEKGGTDIVGERTDNQIILDPKQKLI